MGSSQSCEACFLEKNTSTKSRSYVEELLQIKHSNYLTSQSMESKEVLQSRRERILKALAERKPVKPYAIQLLEARAAAKSEISISDKLKESKVNVNFQSNNAIEPDQRSRILQRLAARRKSKLSATTSPSTLVNTAPSPTVNFLTSPVVNTAALTSTRSVAVNVSSIHTFMPLASNKATQSDPPPSGLSTASQSFLGSVVDSAIQVAPTVQSSPQQTVRLPEPENYTQPPKPPVPKIITSPQPTVILSEPKIYSQPPKPPVPKILTPPSQRTVRLSEPKIYVQPPTPPVPKILTPPPQRLFSQPPLSARQTISAAFSRPCPSSAMESSMTPSQPSFCHLLENVYKDKLTQNKTSMEDKRRYNDRDQVTFPPNKSVPSKMLLTNDQEQPLEFDSDDSCRKRHTAAVDRLTDSLMANWAKNKTSAELLGADEKELSLLTYGETNRPVVPHFPVRREKERFNDVSTKNGFALVLNNSLLPSVRFGKNSHSQLYRESRMENRCLRHQVNKIYLKSC